MDPHGYGPHVPSEGSQNPPATGATSADHGYSGGRTTNQSVYYPTMQHNLPHTSHRSRQMTQYDLFPNFNPGSLAFNHFMYNLNQGQGHFPYENQMNPMPWGTGLQSNLGHMDMDERGNKYVGNGTSTDFETEPDQMNRPSSFEAPSPLPHTVSSPNVSSFVYPISAFSSNGRILQKKPRKHSMDNSDNSELPGMDILPPTNQLPSFPCTYLQETPPRPSGSGLGYLNQTRNSSSHSAGTPDRQMATGDNNIDPGHGHATCIESKLDTNVNHAKGIYHHGEKDGLISNSDSDGSLSGEDTDPDLDSGSLTFKVEIESIVSSDEEVGNSESDESSHTDPFSSLPDASRRESTDGTVQASMSSRAAGRKRPLKDSHDSFTLSSGSSEGERPNKVVAKHHVKLDQGGNEVVHDLLPIKLTSEARATQGIDVPIVAKNLSKTKKRPTKTKTRPIVKKQKQGGSDIPVVSFVDKYFYCGHCSCEFRNCEAFLRHYVAYHDDFFPKLLRKVYTLQMANYDVEAAMNLLLECKICETLFVTKEERTMHLNSTHRDVKWQCLRCGLEFGVLHEWNDHLLHHRPDQKYKCLSCSEEFDSVRMATEHYKKNHDFEEEKPVYGEGKRDNDTLIKLLYSDDYGQQCPHCNRYFDMWNWTDAYGHKRKFLADDPRPFKCVWCPKTYLHNEPLIRHIRDHPPFACPHCDNVRFNLKSDLQLHLMTHLGQQNYIVYNCKICGKTFTQGTDYEKHMNCHYGKTYPCEHCERAFITKRELKLHLFNHSETKPFICDTCGKQFKEKRPLLEHMRIHTGERPFQCEFCPADFPTRSQLRQHRKHNHEERKFKCDKCDWKFPNAYLLNRHYKKHTGNTGFRCDVCFKDLYDKVQLEWHMNTHTGIKPFKCRFCDRAFCAGKSQYIHERTIHKDQVLATKFNSR